MDKYKYEMHVHEGESYEDALSRELDYFINRTDHIGAYRMALNANAQGVVDLIKKYLKEQSPNKPCLECRGTGFFGVSIEGTGSVERVACLGCNGHGRIPKDAEQPDPAPEGYYSDKAVKQFW